MLIDEVVAGGKPEWIQDYHWKRIVAARYSARKFEFSKGAAQIVGRIVMDDPDLILDNRQFARPPYPQTYIEVPLGSFYKSFDERMVDFQGMEPEDWDTFTTAYLFDEHWCYAFGTQGTRATPADQFKFSTAAVNVLAYQMYPPGQDHDTRRAVKGPTSVNLSAVSEFEHHAMSNILGSTVGILMGDDKAKDKYMAIAAEVDIHWLAKKLWASNDDMFQILSGSAGDIRNMWAFLLWLNQPTHTRYIDVPAAHGLIKGKRIPYSSHRVVEIDPTKLRSVRRVLKFEDRESPKRHEVRGEWHNRGGDPACGHSWPMMPNEKGQFRCQKCDRVRYWVREHMRGDATKGFITKTYTVNG